MSFIRNLTELNQDYKFTETSFKYHTETGPGNTPKFILGEGIAELQASRIEYWKGMKKTMTTVKGVSSCFLIYSAIMCPFAAVNRELMTGALTFAVGLASIIVALLAHQRGKESQDEVIAWSITPKNRSMAKLFLNELEKNNKIDPELQLRELFRKRLPEKNDSQGANLMKQLLNFFQFCIGKKLG